MESAMPCKAQRNSEKKTLKNSVGWPEGTLRRSTAQRMRTKDEESNTDYVQKIDC